MLQRPLGSNQRKKKNLFRTHAKSSLSFPDGNVDRQWVDLHHEPVLNLSLPLLVSEAGHPGKTETPQHPAEHNAHLQLRQVLARADCRAVREREESRHVVFSCCGRRRCVLAFAKPSLG